MSCLFKLIASLHAKMQELRMRHCDVENRVQFRLAKLQSNIVSHSEQSLSCCSTHIMHILTISTLARPQIVAVSRSGSLIKSTVKYRTLEQATILLYYWWTMRCKYCYRRDEPEQTKAAQTSCLSCFQVSPDAICKLPLTTWYYVVNGLSPY